MYGKDRGNETKLRTDKMLPLLHQSFIKRWGPTARYYYTAYLTTAATTLATTSHTKEYNNKLTNY